LLLGLQPKCVQYIFFVPILCKLHSDGYVSVELYYLALELSVSLQPHGLMQFMRQILCPPKHRVDLCLVLLLHLILTLSHWVKVANADELLSHFSLQVLSRYYFLREIVRGPGKIAPGHRTIRHLAMDRVHLEDFD